MMSLLSTFAIRFFIPRFNNVSTLTYDFDLFSMLLENIRKPLILLCFSGVEKETSCKK